MPSSEAWIDELLGMSREQRVALYNDEQFRLAILKEHLNDIGYLKQTKLPYTEESILNMLIRKGYTYNAWVFVEDQILSAMEFLEPEELSGSLAHLVKGGWLIRNTRGQYTLAQEVLNGKLRQSSNIVALEAEAEAEEVPDRQPSLILTVRGFGSNRIIKGE